MGGARETALASSTYAPFTRRLLTFTGWNWKCHVIIVIKTDLSGFVVPMHSGLCEQYVLGIWLPVSHAPSCIGTTNPSRTGLNPLNLSSLVIQSGKMWQVVIPWTSSCVYILYSKNNMVWYDMLFNAIPHSMETTYVDHSSYGAQTLNPQKTPHTSPLWGDHCWTLGKNEEKYQGFMVHVLGYMHYAHQLTHCPWMKVELSSRNNELIDVHNTY